MDALTMFVGNVNILPLKFLQRWPRPFCEGLWEVRTPRINRFGEVAEWLKAAVLKTVKDASPSRVRISASPFLLCYLILSSF